MSAVSFGSIRLELSKALSIDGTFSMECYLETGRLDFCLPSRMEDLLLLRLEARKVQEADPGQGA